MAGSPADTDALVRRCERGLLALLGGALVVGWRATARQRRAFEATDRRQQAVLDALQEGVVLIGRDGAVEGANPSARKLLDGRVDRRSVALFDPDGRRLADDEYPRHIAATTGRPVPACEVGLQRPDGSLAWLRVSAIPLPEGPDDRPPYPVVASFSEVTAQRAGVEALRRSNAELRQFAYVASHDLSEPLRMVTSYLQLLRRRYGDGRLGDDADEFIRHAMDGSLRMRALIEDLLSYSRAGRSAQPGPVDCGSLVAVVLADLEPAVHDAEAEVEVGPLPTVLGDRVQLRQVFQNLLANALKFRRGPGARVWVGAEPCAGGWRFSVADDGIGIPAAHVDRVFEMFQRLHTRDDYEGTGIGLAIVRKIVEHHGGSIAVGERPGGGTVFRFELPAAPGAGVQAGGAAPAAPAAVS